MGIEHVFFWVGAISIVGAVATFSVWAVPKGRHAPPPPMPPWSDDAARLLSKSNAQLAQIDADYERERYLNRTMIT